MKTFGKHMINFKQSQIVISCNRNWYPSMSYGSPKCFI